jgi:membrane-bound serine protease (ClpP class)
MEAHIMHAHHTRPACGAIIRKCSCLAGIVVLFVALLALFCTSRIALASSAHVDVIVLNDEIGVVSTRVLTRAIDTAQHDGAQGLVVEIDTPGGDIDAMKTMTQAELASKVPIIAYVTPAGGRAASAGAFVALAAPLVAMAPATRIGASSPVTGSGGDIGSTLKAKIENDLTASITSMQESYARNVPLAVAMVTQARSYDDMTALRQHLINIGGSQATNLTALLQAVNGRTVTMSNGQTVILHTTGVSVQTISATPIDNFYGFLANPNIAFFLFVLAMIGIYLEIAHPGTILPGVVGSIALALFLFAAGLLEPDWAGLILMVLAFILLVLDLRLPTHGVLTLGAVASLVIGSLLFFNTSTAYGVPGLNPWVVYGVAGFVGVLGLTLVTLALRAQRLPVSNGVEGMIGSKVIALTPLLPEGRVRYGGENWAAVLDEAPRTADPGSELVIVSVDGLLLHVRPVSTIHLPFEGYHDSIAE